MYCVHILSNDITILKFIFETLYSLCTFVHFKLNEYLPIDCELPYISARLAVLNLPGITPFWASQPLVLPNSLLV